MGVGVGIYICVLIGIINAIGIGLLLTEIDAVRKELLMIVNCFLNSEEDDAND